jgi:hypothetical protein
MRKLNATARRAFFCALAHGTAIHVRDASLRRGRFGVTDFYDINGHIVRVDYTLKPMGASYSVLASHDATAFKDRHRLGNFLAEVHQLPPERTDVEADGFITVWISGARNGRL